MTQPGLRAILIGAGKMGVGYAQDPVMAKHYRYASHGQVLAAHPEFSWEAVVDVSSEARERARSLWGVPLAVAEGFSCPYG